MTGAPAGAVVVKKPQMSESELQDGIIELAQTLHWRVVHFRPARVVKKGKVSWRTAIQGDGMGFPDLLLLRGSRGIAAELKSGNLKPSAEQLDWLDAFRMAGFETYCWRPSDWMDGVRVVLEAGE